jgi:hypothetical protein
VWELFPAFVFFYVIESGAVVEAGFCFVVHNGCIGEAYPRNVISHEVRVEVSHVAVSAIDALDLLPFHVSLAGF